MHEKYVRLSLPSSEYEQGSTMRGPYRSIGLNATALTRFWSKVKKTKTCWIWTAGRERRGYGTFAPNGRSGKRIKAHRVSWFLAFGSRGLNENHVLHHCDNPSCVRPSHLFLGTDLENMRDMCAKKRHWHQRKRFCPKGHPYSGRNLYIDYCGRRRCRICISQINKRYDQKCRNILQSQH